MKPAELNTTWACERCSEPCRLFVMVGEEFICSACWLACGSPFWKHQEKRTRDGSDARKMAGLAQGGVPRQPIRSTGGAHDRRDQD